MLFQGLGLTGISPCRAVLIAGVLLVFLTGGRFAAGGGRWSHFAVLGADHTNPAAVPFPVALAPKGHNDGQFFMRLATDPWPTEPEAYGLSLDQGAYRHQRILYPTLAWGLSLGNPARAPAALVAINFMAVLGLVYIWSLLALGSGVGAGWGTGGPGDPRCAPCLRKGHCRARDAVVHITRIPDADSPEIHHIDDGDGPGSTRERKTPCSWCSPWASVRGG